MSKLYPSRGAQTVLSTELVFNFDDVMDDVNGVEKDFKTVGTAVFDFSSLPAGAVVVGGELVVETAGVGPTVYTVEIGDATDPNRYLGATSILAAGRTALVPTGFVSGGEALRATVVATVADATAGRVALRAEYVIQDRVSEVYTH